MAKYYFEVLELFHIRLWLFYLWVTLWLLCELSGIPACQQTGLLHKDTQKKHKVSLS